MTLYMYVFAKLAVHVKAPKAILGNQNTKYLEGGPPDPLFINFNRVTYV